MGSGSHTSRGSAGQKVVHQHLLGLIRSPDFATLAIGILIGLGVCAPLLDGGRVFLLDWSIGPYGAVANPTALGLNGGLTSGVVSSVVTSFLNGLLGSAVTWILIFIFFPIATVGAGRLAGRSHWTRISAGVLYAVNPFVFNRIYAGHLPLLLAYALMPYATKAIIKSVSSSLHRWPLPALWWAGLTAISPHFAWIFGLVILGVALVTLFTKQCSFQRVAGWFAVSVSLFALMSSYIFLPHSVTNLPTQVGRVSLDLYRTTGDAHLGLFTNVLALYGFWRLGPGPVLPKEIISGWPFLALAILLVVGVGVSLVRRRNLCEINSLGEYHPSKVGGSGMRPSEVSSPRVDVRNDFVWDLGTRYFAFLILFLGVGGYFLALGDEGPTGWLFLWAYNHVPFFALMREPEKFLMLLALAYAVFFGWGIEYVSKLNLFKSKIGNFTVVAVVGVALPLGYSANIFDGLGGQITQSSVPSSYQQADALMGTGPGNILYLPWHLYMSYPFTSNRVVANIGAGEFRRTVISGDDVQAGGVESQSTSPRSAYLQVLFSEGPAVREFGALVAPLGVQYLVLAKTVDWASYSWLSDQRDLTVIIDTPSLEVWRNKDYAGIGWRAPKLTSVTGADGLLTLAKADGLVGRALVISSGDPGPPNADSSQSNQVDVGSSSSPPTVQELSPVAYRIAAGNPGWVSVDAPFQHGWILNGQPAIKSAEGTLLVRVGASGGLLQFTPWRLVRLGYILSASTFVLFSALVIVGFPLENRRRMKRGDPDEDAGMKL